jgi:hypothetical protein
MEIDAEVGQLPFLTDFDESKKAEQRVDVADFAARDGAT